MTARNILSFDFRLTPAALRDPVLMAQLEGYSDRPELRGLNPWGPAYQQAAARLALLEHLRDPSRNLETSAQTELLRHCAYHLNLLGRKPALWRRALPQGAFISSPFPNPDIWGVLSPQGDRRPSGESPGYCTAEDIERAGTGGFSHIRRFKDGEADAWGLVRPWSPLGAPQLEEERQTVRIEDYFNRELPSLAGVQPGSSLTFTAKDPFGRVLRIGVVERVASHQFPVKPQGPVLRFVGEEGWAVMAYGRPGEPCLPEDRDWTALHSWGVYGMMMAHEVAFGGKQYLLRGREENDAFVRVRQVLEREVKMISRSNAVLMPGVPGLDYSAEGLSQDELREVRIMSAKPIFDLLKTEEMVFLVQDDTVLAAVDRVTLSKSGKSGIMTVVRMLPLEESDTTITNLDNVVDIRRTRPDSTGDAVPVITEERTRIQTLLGDLVDPSTSHERRIESAREGIRAVAEVVLKQAGEGAGFEERETLLSGALSELEASVEVVRRRTQEVQLAQLAQLLDCPVEVIEIEDLKEGRDLLRRVKIEPVALVVRGNIRGRGMCAVLLSPHSGEETTTEKVSVLSLQRARLIGRALDGERIAISSRRVTYAVLWSPRGPIGDLVGRIDWEKVELTPRKKVL